MRFLARRTNGKAYGLGRWLRCCWLVGSLAYCQSLMGAPRIVFDYSYDSIGFFNAERREVMDMAADSINRWVDALSPIVESGGNTWVAQYFRPDTGVGVMIPAGSGFSVPANDIRVYVGARDLGAPYLAVAQPSGAVGFGSQEWKDAVSYRGQTPGPPYVDFGPWSSSVAFNTNVAINWYSQADPSEIAVGQYDLFSVAAHELLHVFGFGIAPSYFSLSGSGNFTGPKAIAAGSASNPSLTLSAGGDHWAEGTTGSLMAQQKPSIITPTIWPGSRLRPTDLDLAAVDDLGWQAALSGDVNRDRVVDFSDAFTFVSNYGMQHTAGWSKGDFNGDGHVSFSDAFELVSNYGASYATTTNSSFIEPNLELIYNPDTGELSVAGSLTSGVKSLSIASASGMLLVGQASWLAGDTTFTENTSNLTGFGTLSAFGNSFLVDKQFSLGAILPAHLPQERLLSDLTIAFGVEGQVGIFEANLVYLSIPEPSSAALLMMALFGLWRIRGKRKR